LIREARKRGAKGSPTRGTKKTVRRKKVPKIFGELTKLISSITRPWCVNVTTLISRLKQALKVRYVESILLLRQIK